MGTTWPPVRSKASTPYHGRTPKDDFLFRLWHADWRDAHGVDKVPVYSHGILSSKCVFVCSLETCCCNARSHRTKNAREAFECNRRFWGIIFEKAECPILWEMFRKLDDRMTRYYPLLLVELYPTPESRPRQHETLIEIYRKGQIAEALRAFKQIYLKMVDDIVASLEAQESAESVD